MNVGGDTDRGNSDKKEDGEEENSTDNGLDTEQHEDTDTSLSNQQKESNEVSHQSDEEPDGLEFSDGTRMQDRNASNEVHNAWEGLRSRKPDSEQRIGGDTDRGNSDKKEDGEEENSTDNGLDTKQHEDTDTSLSNQQKESNEVNHQSDEEPDGLVFLDGTRMQDRNASNEMQNVWEGLRLRKPDSEQRIVGGDTDRGNSDKKEDGEEENSTDNENIHKDVKTPCAGDTSWWLTCISFFLLAIVVVFYWYSQNTSPLPKERTILEVFGEELAKVQTSFPSQHFELWRRSKIHLQQHLNRTNPTEPASVILTSGSRAEKTLGCLAQQLAAAFSKALNSSVLDIYGTRKSAQDSDVVKLDIDKALTEAFQSGKRAAVIHRFEEIPPGSTLIFYRYCDHENAAFKKVFLAFTVMLQDETDFSRNTSLGIVEEVVQEYLQEKFVSTDKTARFNQMDLDKLSGLWSRISHLVLPVVAEQKIEQHGC